MTHRRKRKESLILSMLYPTVYEAFATLVDVNGNVSIIKSGSRYSVIKEISPNYIVKRVNGVYTYNVDQYCYLDGIRYAVLVNDRPYTVSIASANGDEDVVWKRETSFYHKNGRQIK